LPTTDGTTPRTPILNDGQFLSALTKGVQCKCSGCGATLQSKNPKQRGYVDQSKLEEWLVLSEDPLKVLADSPDEQEQLSQQVARRVKGEPDEACVDDIEDYFPDSIDKDEATTSSDCGSIICKRCFSLQHYNSALNITLDSQDYLEHLSSLTNKKSLLILMLDVADFPSCIFPNLKSLISEESSVLIVANKIDLFPRNLDNSFWSKLRDHIITECRERSLGDHKIVGVRFVSVKQGMGTTELAQEIVRKWGGRGDIYLLGCTNVGKSSLFNKLLIHLCGSKPGELNTDNNLLTPQATISQWPGTTLGLLSFPLISLGKRRRLSEQQRKREEQVARGAMSKYACFTDVGTLELPPPDHRSSLRRRGQAFVPDVQLQRVSYFLSII
jgi:GTP-binding protein EngB required for normal cell division